VCAAVEPADDAAAALYEQKIVASREADAARRRRRRSREADVTATLRCVWSGLCAVRCVMCVGQAAAHVLCLVAPEMSKLQRCPGDTAFGVSMVICVCVCIYIYICICKYIHIYMHTYIRSAYRMRACGWGGVIEGPYVCLYTCRSVYLGLTRTR